MFNIIEEISDLFHKNDDSSSNYKIAFRVGSEKQFLWKEIKGVYLEPHANEIAKSLIQRQVFCVFIPEDEYKKHGLPLTFDVYIKHKMPK